MNFIKRVSKGSIFLVIFSLFIFIVACGSSDDTSGSSSDSSSSEESTEGTEEKDSIVLKLNTYEANSMWEDTAIAFKEEVENLTNGEIEVEIHLNSPFGGEREVTEMMQMGSVEMAVMTHGPMGIWVEEFNVFDLPFLFENRDHAYAVLDSDIVTELAKEFEEEAGVKIIGWVGTEFVQMTNNKQEFKSADDVKGLKLRVQENEVQIDTWKAFGANPTAMPWPEVFTGLEQGVIDGTSNNLKSILDNHIHEVNGYASKVNERFGAVGIQISKKVFDELSPELQEAVLAAGEHAQQVGRDSNAKSLPEAEKELIDLGVVVSEPEDIQSFKDKVGPVYDKWVPEFGEDLVDRIQNLEY